MKKLVIINIAVDILYAIVVGSFLIFRTSLLLTMWEIFTIIGAFTFYFLLLKLSQQGNKKYNKAIRGFSFGLVFFSTLTHMINLCVTRPMIAIGKDVPTHFQIGYWFSFEMLLDYIAWGLCLGSAFILLYRSLKSQYRVEAKISLACGTLCMIGFCGGLFNMNLWYFAPFGYVVGFIILCIVILKNKKLIQPA